MMDQKSNNEIVEPSASLARHLSRFICARAEPEFKTVLQNTVKLLVKQNIDGHVCLDLRRFAGKAYNGVDYPVLDEWENTLKASRVVNDADTSADATQPLTLEFNRLYLQRNWCDERDISEAIKARLKVQDIEKTKQLLPRITELFSQDTEQPNWQKIAVGSAVVRPFSVIAGGPGTGKTTTVVRLLVLLQTQNPELKVSLAAPTGKAAARLLESIQSGADRMLNENEMTQSEWSAMPDTATTIHRLLKAGRHGFQHNKENPLITDCLILDEASMIDQRLMASVVRALPDHARLILLGDRDQLASVDAGSVLGDISGHGRDIRIDSEIQAQLKVLGIAGLTEQELLPEGNKQAEVAPAISLLRKSWRFDENSGIGKLAAAINSGNSVEAADCFGSGKYSDLLFENQQDYMPSARIVQWFCEHFNKVLEQENVEQALQEFSRFRLLCALRKGPWGIEELSARITARMYSDEKQQTQKSLHGMPILITRNDRETGLNNGDIGLIWVSKEGAAPVACFDSAAGLRQVSFYELPSWEPAWAMTIHKSQGSEFDEVMVVLPVDGSPVSTRELLYTAVTRAKKKLILASSEHAMEQSIEQTVQRDSGLMVRLGWSK